ncbi:unnamed protein product, partial [Allacma fusca]
QGSETSVFISH